MKRIQVLLFVVVVFLISCKEEPMPDLNTEPVGVNLPDSLIPDSFVAVVNNRYFPLIPGTTYCYINNIIENGETITQNITVEVTTKTKNILGVNTTVVHDVVREDGRIIEDTFDWYAQDQAGNVWYFGEDTRAFEEDGTISTEGSWTAGEAGARAGIIMWANPGDHLNQAYYQEYLAGEAEDQGTVSDTSSTASVKYGNFTNCVRTKDFTELEPDVEENKYYAPGIGLILAVSVKGDKEREELVKVIKPKGKQ